MVALKRRNLLVAAVLLGFTLATKQYLVVALPAFWLLRGVFARRDWLILLGSAVAVTLPFLLANPREFWRAVVEWQLIQPFRSDSVSLLALSVNQFGVAARRRLRRRRRSPSGWPSRCCWPGG